MGNFTNYYYGMAKIKETLSSLKDSVALYGEGVNAVTDAGKIVLEYDIDYINKTVMIPVNVFSDFLGAIVCTKTDGCCIEFGEKYVCIKIGDNQISTNKDNNFECLTLSHTTYEKNSILYVPGEEIAKILGFSVFSDGRLLCIGTEDMIRKLRRPLNMGVNEYNEIVSQIAYEKTIEFETLTAQDTNEPKKRWRELLVGNEKNNDMSNPNIRSIIDKIDIDAENSRSLLIKDNSRKSIFKDIPMTESAHMTYAFRYVTPMAKAYACSGSKYYQDKTMLEDVIYCLDFLTDNYYSKEGRINWKNNTFDNWWDWNCGSAQELINCLFCIENELSQEQIQKYLLYYSTELWTPHPSGGANTATTCLFITCTALLLNNYKKIIEMNDIILGTYLYGDDNERLTETAGYLVRDGKPIIKGTGFFADGSYVFHYLHAMNALYGFGNYIALSKYEYIVAGTKFDLNNPLKFNLPELFFNGIDTINYGTSIFSNMRARYAVNNNYTYAAEPLVHAYLMAEHYDENTKNTIYGIVKDTYINTPYKSSIISYLPINYVKKFEEMIDDENIIPRGEIKQSKTFYNADRVIHKRDKWAVGIAMSSSRIFNYESIGGENKTGWYHGDGRTEWHIKDTNINLTKEYWQSIDPYRIPGTTVDTQKRKKVSIHMGNEYLSSKDFVGGVSLNNEYSIASMELESYHSDVDFGIDLGGYGGKNPAHQNDLTAKKSYFMTDDSLICLGTDIKAKCNNNAEVLTIVENILGTNPLYTNKGELEIFSDDVDMTGINWANYDNTCGYWFPQDNKTTQLGTLKTRRTKGDSSHLEIWYSHGENPDNGGYAYVLIPGADAEYTKAFAESGNIEILLNNEKIQAIKDKRTNVTYIVFWQKGEFEGISLEKPGLVITRESDTEYEIALSDPTQMLASNTLTINKLLKPVKLDEFAITEVNDQNTSISCDMTYLSGRTIECIFKK